ncbi:MAG: hypothetical protein JSV63_02280 [Candidatus Aenigmatarchaeota archaeon]|nr:MAG: hypothetical protein JSV63_02280 [Candidatus Aenigmarchaeota archaeon]
MATIAPISGCYNGPERLEDAEINRIIPIESVADTTQMRSNLAHMNQGDAIELGDGSVLWISKKLEPEFMPEVSDYSDNVVYLEYFGPDGRRGDYSPNNPFGSRGMFNLSSLQRAGLQGTPGNFLPPEDI